MIFETYPQSNTSHITTHPDYDINNILSIVDILYSIADGIVKKLLYTAVINLFGSEGAVDVMKFNFSEFELHCRVLLTNNIHGRYI